MATSGKGLPFIGKMNEFLDKVLHPTVNKTGNSKASIDVRNIAYYKYNTLPLVCEIGSTNTQVKLTNHGVQAGDLFRIISTSNSIKEYDIVIDSIIDANNFRLAGYLSDNLSPGDTFDIYKPTFERLNSDGSTISESSPVKYNRKVAGVTTQVEVTDDQDTQSNTRALPVALKSIDGAPINITAGDLNVNVNHANDSVKIGDGTTLAGVTVNNELKVNDSTSNAILMAMATKAGGSFNILNDQVFTQRNNQIEVNFETLPSTSLLTRTVTSTGSITATSGHTVFSSGSGATATAKAVTVQNTKYRPANELYAYFTAAFTIPNNDFSSQRIGVYDANNGFFIGFNQSTFGVVKRSAGSDDVCELPFFNGDPLDGSSSSKYTRNGVPEAFDPTYSNLFRIRFAWLGSAPIMFEICSPDGNWIVMHTFKTPNSQLNPSIQNPDLPMTAEVIKYSGSGTQDIKMYTACWAAGSTSSYIPIVEQLSENTLAAITRSVITGQTTAGGGGFVNVKVNPSGAMVTATTVDSSALPTGASTSALQTTGNSSLSSIVTNTGLMVTYGATSDNQVTGNASLSSIDSKVTGLATATAQTIGNTSLGNLDTNIGAKADAVASTDTGTFSLIALIKKVAANITAMSAKLPASLGAQTAANSLSITQATGTTLTVNQTVSTAAYSQSLVISGASATTFASPGPTAKWCKVQADESNAYNLRFIIGGTATGSSGMQLQPGRDMDFFVAGDISIISENAGATAQKAYVTWGL